MAVARGMWIEVSCLFEIGYAQQTNACYKLPSQRLIVVHPWIVKDTQYWSR